MGRIAPLERASLVKCFDEGVSNLVIKKKLHISTPTVSTWRARWLNGDKTLEDKPKSGRPRTAAGYKLAIERAWEALPQSAIDKIIANVKWNVDKISENGGEWLQDYAALF